MRSGKSAVTQRTTLREGRDPARTGRPIAARGPDAGTDATATRGTKDRDWIGERERGEVIVAPPEAMSLPSLD